MSDSVLERPSAVMTRGATEVGLSLREEIEALKDLDCNSDLNICNLIVTVDLYTL